MFLLSKLVLNSSAKASSLSHCHFLIVRIYVEANHHFHVFIGRYAISSASVSSVNPIFYWSIIDHMMPGDFRDVCFWLAIRDAEYSLKVLREYDTRFLLVEYVYMSTLHSNKISIELVALFQIHQGVTKIGGPRLCLSRRGMITRSCTLIAGVQPAQHLGHLWREIEILNFVKTLQPQSGNSCTSFSITFLHS